MGITNTKRVNNYAKQSAKQTPKQRKRLAKKGNALMHERTPKPELWRLKNA